MTENVETAVSENVLKSVVKGWNRAHPIGTPITYWPGFIEGPGIASHTRSAAWILPSGSPVALVEDHAGGIALTHIVNREV